VWLLIFAFAAGIGQLFRLALGDRAVARHLRAAAIPVLIPWVLLYVFITVRLAGFLGIGA